VQRAVDPHLAEEERPAQLLPLEVAARRRGDLDGRSRISPDFRSAAGTRVQVQAAGREPQPVLGERALEAPAALRSTGSGSPVNTTSVRSRSRGTKRASTVTSSAPVPRRHAPSTRTVFMPSGLPRSPRRCGEILETRR
jgi:hypothetical protein